MKPVYRPLFKSAPDIRIPAFNLTGARVKNTQDRPPPALLGGKGLTTTGLALAASLLEMATPRAHAQGIPNAPNAGSILNQQTKAPPPDTQAKPEDPQVRLPEAKTTTTQGGLSILINSITFVGDPELAHDAALQALIKPALGKTLDHPAMQTLADQITRHLRACGYTLARAWLPRQDLTDGDLRIALTLGRLESSDQRIQVNGAVRDDPARLRDIAAAALPEGEPLRDEDLERALLLLNDQPGIHARGALDEGSQPGTSRLLIRAEQTPVLRGMESVDNYGSRATGQWRGAAGIALDDPLGIGDQFTLNGNASDGARAAAGGFNMPLTASGLRLLLDASYLNYHVVQDTYKALELRGQALTGSVGLAYPLLRSRLQNLNLSATYAWKGFSDDAIGNNISNRHSNSLTLALDGNRQDSLGGGGNLSAQLAFDIGHLDRSGNLLDAQADAQGARTAGSYKKLNLNLSRLQNLGGGDWSLFASLSGQVASGNLDSSEKFILGGPSGLRAYPVGEADGDQGVIGTLELRRYLNLGLSNGGKLQALAFADAGEIQQHRAPWRGSVLNADQSNAYSLASVGVGANLWLNFWSVRAAVAHTVGDNPGRSPAGLDSDGRANQWRAWVQISAFF